MLARTPHLHQMNGLARPANSPSLVLARNMVHDTGIAFLLYHERYSLRRRACKEMRQHERDATLETDRDELREMSSRENRNEYVDKWRAHHLGLFLPVRGAEVFSVVFSSAAARLGCAFRLNV